MIFNRYILRETVKTQIALFIILTAIFLCQSLVQILTQATKGDIPASLVSQILLLSIPNMSVFMLPLTVFLALLVTLARLGGDSEIIVMRSFGISPNENLKIALYIGCATALIALFNSLYLLPVSQQKQVALLEGARENSSYFALDSGKFLRLGTDSTVIAYVDDMEKGKGKHQKNEGAEDSKDSQKGATDSPSNELRKLKNIYLFFMGNDHYPKSYAVAQDGNIIKDAEGIMWFVLNNGTSYSGPNRKNQYTVTDFDEYKFWLSETSDNNAKSKIATVSTGDLLGRSDPPARAEFQWRICVALAIPVLALIVVPLGGVKPRQGRFSRLLPAILIYGSYFLFTGALKNLVDRETFPAMPGLYLVPILYALFLAVPLNLTETKWYKRRQLLSVRKVNK